MEQLAIRAENQMISSLTVPFLEHKLDAVNIFGKSQFTLPESSIIKLKEIWFSKKQWLHSVIGRFMVSLWIDFDINQHYVQRNFIKPNNFLRIFGTLGFVKFSPVLQLR